MQSTDQYHCGRGLRVRIDIHSIDARASGREPNIESICGQRGPNT
jgi:hypothetical protein